VWRLDEAGNVLEPVAESEGIWIAQDVIAYIQFLGRPEESDGAVRDINEPSDQRRDAPRRFEESRGVYNGERPKPKWGKRGTRPERDPSPLPPRPTPPAAAGTPEE
jgi:hypothetical protein